MPKLSEQEKQKLIELLQEGKTIPSHFKSKLFDTGDTEYVEVTKDYKLIYKGKEPKEKIIANTPPAPFQKVRSFNSDNAFKDDWQNMLIFGDNLLALKTLYEDQRGENKYKTKNKIKLIYIDPPFATKQDFMKDREKAYRDKIIGAQFIEFLRKRLILLREILADDGTIYVHLDWKKGHYIKAIMDDVFGEHNFLNEIVWYYRRWNIATNLFARNHDTIFLYAKNSQNYFWNQQYIPKSEKSSGQGRAWQSIIGEDGIRRSVLLDELSIGVPMPDTWEISMINPVGIERKMINYPTQKPEALLERIINATSNENDIVLDSFSGSGTTLSVAGKLSRRWIGIDCGKLAIYTIQKRMLNLTTQIGSLKKDERRVPERVDDFEEHLKNSRGLFLIADKARKGELVIDDNYLKLMSKLLNRHLRKGDSENFSICLPEDKFKVKDLEVIDNEEGVTGEKTIKIGRINFLISFIQPKEKPEKEKPLKAKEFTLYNAGIYNNAEILNLDWETYKPFVSQLFGLRPEEHKIHGFIVDGYIGTYPAFIWNYPEQKNLKLDREYVSTLHTVLGGKAGDKFYVVAPVTAMSFMEDEIQIESTIYVFLKVPLSVLKALLESGETGSLRQPTSVNDVNEVIDAVGFDFISQPVVNAKYYRDLPLNATLEDQDKKDYVIEINEFKSDTLVYDPEDFENFETLSMVMIDTNYNDNYFNLAQVFWSDKIIAEDKSKALIRIPQDLFVDKKMMIIYLDKYGNELKIIKTKKDFDEPTTKKRRSGSKTKKRRKK